MLASEKLAQAKDLVAKSGFDLWMTFVRETAGLGDPVLPLILDGGLTWQSALIVTKAGKTIAVLGNYDADPLISSGNWDEVVPYIQSIREPLLAVLDRECGPNPKIAVNFSESDDKCDGLTHGMFVMLQRILAGTRLERSLVSAEEIVRNLRGIKSQTELDRVSAAIAEGDRIFAEVPVFAKRGVSERAIFDEIQARIRSRGLGFSWDEAGDPIVNSGPDSMAGHGIPSSEIVLEDGHIFHIDLGVLKDGYASDIQRCWYVGDSIPEDVAWAFKAVNDAISAGAAMLKPGVQGFEVDAAARKSLVESGYPEYMHAFGHQVGRMAHDGGTILGPCWDRYGKSPMQEIQIGEVYTLELGVDIAGRGYLGVEEMAVVTERGCRFLSQRQLTLPQIVP